MNTFTDNDLFESGKSTLDLMLENEQLYNVLEKNLNYELEQKKELNQIMMVINQNDKDESFALYLQQEELRQDDVLIERQKQRLIEERRVIELNKMVEQEQRRQRELKRIEDQRQIELKRIEEQRQIELKKIKEQRQIENLAKFTEQTNLGQQVECPICCCEIANISQLTITLCCQTSLHQICAMRCFESQGLCPFCRNAVFM